MYNNIRKDTDMASQVHNSTETPRLITIPQGCERSQMGRSYLYDQIKKGNLRVVKVGRAARLVESEFNAWLAELIAQ